MKKFFLLISIFAILHAKAQITFEKTYEITTLRAIVQSEDSGYYIVGEFTNSNWQTNSFITHTNKYGEILWHKDFGFSNYTYCRSATVTSSGHVVVAGAGYLTYRDLFLTKFDQDGDSLWTKTYNFILIESISKIITTPDDGFLVIGEGTELIGGHIRYFGFAILLDQNGNLNWYRRIENENTATFVSPQSVIMYKQNGLAICGYACDTTTSSLDWPVWVNVTRMDLMGETVFSKEFEIASGDQNYCGNDLCQDNQGNLVVCASRAINPSSQAPTWLIKLNEWGDTLFTKTVALDGYVGGHQTIFNAGASGFVVGTHMVVYPNAFAALFKVDTTFNLSWQSTFDGLNFARFWNAIATTDGGYAILGTTYDLNNQPYGYLAKTDEDGLITGIGETLTGRKPVPYAIEPNPIAGHTISLRASEGFQGPLHFEVLSSTGQCVYKGHANPGAGSTVLKIELPNFVKGLYILKVLPQNAATKSSAYKLIIN